MFARYAIYLTADGALAAKGASWLGWDINQGVPMPHPDSDAIDLADLTRRPRKYGFHATIKAPFRLADGQDVADLQGAAQALCAGLDAVTLEGLQIARLGRFLALVPVGDVLQLGALASAVVRGLDHFRAPATPAELERRRRANLTSEQEANLIRWGYPHVMQQFRFHMTLTGPLSQPDQDAALAAASTHFGQTLPSPFVIDRLTLVGERADGQWQSIAHFPLR